MDWTKSRRCIAAIALLATASCSQGTGPTASTPPPQPPDQVVSQFLEAVRTGDDKEAAALLTAIARKKMTESEMVVAPPGSDTASFTVGEVEMQNGKARVTSVWTDNDGQGQPHSDQIVWILKQEPTGWRISGMAANVLPDQGPVELNFEDPAEMHRRQQMAEDELARREQAERQQLQQSLDRGNLKR